MFRRRDPIPLWSRLRGWLWPHIGWRRMGAYTVKRLTRLSDTPHSVAAGMASGVAVSFTPFVGLHLLGSLLLSLLVRGNLLAAAAGTLVGNPWTFPFIWLATYNLGQYLLGNPPGHAADISSLNWSNLIANIEALAWPMTVGGLPLGLVAGTVTYLPLVRIVAAYQVARRRRRERLAPRVKPKGVSIETGAS